MVAAVNEALEFRIHGIGNHPAWSALGSPQRVDQGRFPSIDQPADEGGARYRPAQDSWVDQFRPPDADPDIRLLVWSRTSRIVAGLLWFLAIPMTTGTQLVQAAPQDFMAKPGAWMQCGAAFPCWRCAAIRLMW